MLWTRDCGDCESDQNDGDLLMTAKSQALDVRHTVCTIIGNCVSGSEWQADHLCHCEHHSAHSSLSFCNSTNLDIAANSKKHKDVLCHKDDLFKLSRSTEIRSVILDALFREWRQQRNRFCSILIGMCCLQVWPIFKLQVLTWAISIVSFVMTKLTADMWSPWLLLEFVKAMASFVCLVTGSAPVALWEQLVLSCLLCFCRFATWLWSLKLQWPLLSLFRVAAMHSQLFPEVTLATAPPMRLHWVKLTDAAKDWPTNIASKEKSMQQCVTKSPNLSQLFWASHMWQTVCFSMKDFVDALQTWWSTLQWIFHMLVNTHDKIFSWTQVQILQAQIPQQSIATTQRFQRSSWTSQIAFTLPPPLHMIVPRQTCLTLMF